MHPPAQLHSLERSRAEDDHISLLGEHHEVWRARSTGMDDREADRSLERKAVRDDEALRSFTPGAE